MAAITAAADAKLVLVVAPAGSGKTEGWPARDACAALGLREADQHRLLHHARTRVICVLEGHGVTLEQVSSTAT